MINLFKFFLPSFYLIFLNIFVLLIAKFLLDQTKKLYDLKKYNKNYFSLFFVIFLKFINYKFPTYEKKLIENYLAKAFSTDDSLEKKLLSKKLLLLKTQENTNLEKSYKNLILLLFF